MDNRPVKSGVGTTELFKLFLAESRSPTPFYQALAHRTVAQLPTAVRGQRVLDLGCGPGYYSAALAERGASVVALDRDLDEVVLAQPRLNAAAQADAASLPLASASIEGVFCSNMLEHTGNPDGVISEIERVLVPGGWAWVSWTNWYSPWGGHEISPLHYFGPRLGLRLHRRLRGEPRKNVPGVGLFPTHIGSTLAMVRRRPGLRLVKAEPRYYPSQRWVMKVPGFREVASWNCVMFLERTPTTGGSFWRAVGR